MKVNWKPIQQIRFYSTTMKLKWNKSPKMRWDLAISKRIISSRIRFGRLQLATSKQVMKKRRHRKLVKMKSTRLNQMKMLQIKKPNSNNKMKSNPYKTPKRKIFLRFRKLRFNNSRVLNAKKLRKNPFLSTVMIQILLIPKKKNKTFWKQQHNQKRKFERPKRPKPKKIKSSLWELPIRFNWTWILTKRNCIQLHLMHKQWFKGTLDQPNAKAIGQDLQTRDESTRVY